MAFQQGYDYKLNSKLYELILALPSLEQSTYLINDLPVIELASDPVPLNTCGSNREASEVTL
jgi:hypothetical protein